MFIHRWRKLEGSDPKRFALIQKIQSLQKRLVKKSEEVVAKQNIIKEQEKLYVSSCYTHDDDDYYYCAFVLVMETTTCSMSIALYRAVIRALISRNSVCVVLVSMCVCAQICGIEECIGAATRSRNCGPTVGVPEKSACEAATAQEDEQRTRNLPGADGGTEGQYRTGPQAIPRVERSVLSTHARRRKAATQRGTVTPSND